MFGRYPLPLWRKVAGVILIALFVWNFYVLAGEFMASMSG